ncbi:MAG TPA: class I SAM-dependent methyltransferase [Acidobacteriaceae bacterium]|nr:class I SAM-dependent methyltransferase [Acidobacteriaceae bacterium]
MEQDLTSHWETIYRSKPDETLSWHQAFPGLSYRLIRQYARPGSSVMDAGGGSSALIGMLAKEGFAPCMVIDLSQAALDRARERLEPSIRDRIEWRAADLLGMPQLPSFDVWHDRAVFHFLSEPAQRAAYVALAGRTVRPGGIAIVGAFHLEGPEKCSGLPVQRYGAESLAKEFESSFELVKAEQDVHSTPWGARQPFVYVVMKRR